MCSRDGQILVEEEEKKRAKNAYVTHGVLLSRRITPFPEECIK